MVKRFIVMLAKICLVPDSAHGTNAASAAMAGMKVIVVKTVPKTGDIDRDHLMDIVRQPESYRYCQYKNTFSLKSTANTLLR